jgi:hypothetical protein
LFSLRVGWRRPSATNSLTITFPFRPAPFGIWTGLGLDKSKPRPQGGMQLVRSYLRVNLDCLRSTNQLFNIVQLRGLEFQLLFVRLIGMALFFEHLTSYGNLSQPFRSFTYLHNFANFTSYVCCYHSENGFLLVSVARTSNLFTGWQIARDIWIQWMFIT